MRKTAFKILKKTRLIWLPLLGIYGAIGIANIGSKQELCGQVNRFVLNNNSVETVSVVLDGEQVASGFVIKNSVYFPFYIHFGARKRRDRLVEGRSYKFTTIGFRVFSSRPAIVKDSPVDACSAGDI